MHIHVLGWEKFNLRKDVKAPSWFRLSHNLFEDHEFYDFTHTEIVAWIYILSLASKKSSSRVLINKEHVERVGRIKHKDFLGAVKKLELIHCVTVYESQALRARDEHDTQTGATLHNITLHNITLHHTLADSANLSVSFDFEKLYKQFPRKEGKQRGLAICKTQIKTSKDYIDIEGAIKRYADYCAKNITAPRYIKHFSTFMGSWRDWLDPETGSVAKLEKPEPEWVKKIKEEEAKNAVRGV